MIKQSLLSLSDRVSEAHARIQRNFADLNPIVGVSQGMRQTGIPADAITIDCLKTGRRILLVLHDQQPDRVHYQFAYREQDPLQAFKHLPLSAVDADMVYAWIESYFK